MKLGPGDPVFSVRSLIQLNLNPALKNAVFAAAALAAFLSVTAFSGGVALAAPPPTTSEITVSPTSVNFGSKSISGSFTQTIQITNNETFRLQLAQLSLSGSGFTLASVPSSLSIAAHGSLSVNVVFAPKSASNYSASLQIFMKTALIDSVSISGTGIQTSTLTATPSEASFGNVPIGVSNSQTIRVENNLTVPVLLGSLVSSGAEFTVTNLPTKSTIAAHGSVSFNVVFTPKAATSYAASLPLIGNGTKASSIQLAGSGIVSTTSLSLSTSNLNFGSDVVGTKTTLPVTVTSSGNSSVTISSITTAGTGFSSTGIANGTVLKAGQFATLEITFDPTTAGASTGKITIAMKGTSPAIALTGTGVSASAQSVSLRWNTTSGASGYYVYRGSKSGGPYSRLNSSAVPAADYVDSAVAGGQTYYYVVTAVNANKVESSYSNQAQAAVPENSSTK